MEIKKGLGMPSVCKLGHVQIPTVAYCLRAGKAQEGYKSTIIRVDSSSL